MYKGEHLLIALVQLYLKSCGHLCTDMTLTKLHIVQEVSSHDAFDTALKFEENDVDNVSLLTVSVQGKQYSITPHVVSQMPLQSFSALWTVSSYLA